LPQNTGSERGILSRVNRVEVEASTEKSFFQGGEPETLMANPFIRGNIFMAFWY